MPTDLSSVLHRSFPCERTHSGSGGWAPITVPTTALSGQRRLDSTARDLDLHTRGPRGASAAHPIWQTIRLRAVGASILGHDVSGTGRQILGRAMQSVTTMMPVWP